VCDVVYATVVPDDAGLMAAVLFWARSTHYGVPLVLLDWDVRRVQASMWADVSTKIEALRKRCRSRYPTPGALVEGEALANQARARGCPARPVVAHLTVPDAWPSIVLVAGHYVDAGEVKLTRPAADKIAAAKEGKQHG